jgi:hypothetical protein
MKFARAVVCTLFVLSLLCGSSFAQTQIYPSGIPAGSNASGYGPYDWLNIGAGLKTYKMACFESAPNAGPDTCLYRDIAGHFSMYDGRGVQLLGQLPYVAGTFDNIPVTAVADTDTNFHALAGPLTLTSVAVGGVYTGTITGGASNALVGQYFNTTGFTNAVNNKAGALCTASTATTITLAGGQTIAETASAFASNDIPLLANSLGVPGKRVRIHASGVANVAAASLLNLEVMLCQVPGCGSGTIVAPAGCAITTTNQANVLANDQWTLDCTLTATATVGSAGTFWAKGTACANLGAAASAVLSCFADTATAASAAVDETKNEYVNIGFKFSTSNAGNTVTPAEYAVEVLD